MCTQFNPWKKSLIFIVFLFVLPNTLTGQNSQFSSEITMKEVVKSSSSQPGDFLMAPLIGNVKVLFISVKYPGDASGIVSTSELRNDAKLVKKNIEGNSYDKVSLTIDVTVTLTMPNPDTYYTNDPKSTYIRIMTDALKVAEQAGFDVDSYDREVIFSRQLWNGKGSQGSLNRRTCFMNNSREYTMVHELGHTFGWRHADFWRVSGGSPISSIGKLIEYGDKYDMMGSRGAPPPYPAGIWHHFNPWLKYRNGWLPDESILNVTDSGTYTIQALASDPMTGTSVTKYTALKIRRDALTDYWVFFRGSEEFINNGPVITRIFNTNVKPTELLDMTPGSRSENEDFKDAALAVDNTFSDTEAGISVKTVSASSTEVRVEVTVDPNAIAALDNLPVIDIVSPVLGQRTQQGVVDYEVTAFDPDVGTFDGAGIEKVKLFIHIGNDPLITNLRQGLDPPTPQATMEFSAPPYLWQVDTNTSSPYLPDSRFWFIVKATSVQGGVKFIQFEHLIDNSALPAAPVLSSPSDNATNVSTDTTLVWSFSSGATSYQVQVSTESGFSTTVVDQSGLTSTSYPVSGLSNSTTYYWRVRARNAAGPGAWSPVWQFSTTGAGSPPAAPALSSPSDNATNVSADTTLVWSFSSEATSYQVQVSTVVNFSTIELDQSGLTATSFPVTGLSNSTVYFWRVNATNANGTSPYSPVWQFTTIVAVPAVPALFLPADNATDVPTRPDLVWNASVGAISYDVQVSAQSDFTTLEVDRSGLSVTSFQTTVLSNSTTYYWRVRAANAGGPSDWSSVRHFTTIVAAPAAPGLSSPADNAMDIAIDTTLVWNLSAGAVSYGLQVSTASDFLTTVVEKNELTETSFQVDDLENETTYFWHVNATNSGGTSPWSTVRKFTTEQVTSVETGSEIPSDFRLGQNYPNPFNPTTNISFDLPKAEYVTLKIYTLLGTEVVTLVSETLPAGKYTVKFDASRLSSGVFFYKLQTSSFVQTRKMLLVR